MECLGEDILFSKAVQAAVYVTQLGSRQEAESPSLTPLPLPAKKISRRSQHEKKTHLSFTHTELCTSLSLRRFHQAHLKRKSEGSLRPGAISTQRPAICFLRFFGSACLAGSALSNRARGSNFPGDFLQKEL